jgi:hypothetical protein
MPTYWLVVPTLVALYMALFLLRRGVTLRPGRLAALLVVAVVVRLLLVTCGLALEIPWEPLLGGVLLVMAGVLFTWRRAWLLRLTTSELREQIETACRGLLLPCQEIEPGRFRLTVKGASHDLWFVPLTAGVQVLVLPAVQEHNKVALLLSWIMKTFPGPTPRFRIVLKRGAT